MELMDAHCIGWAWGWAWAFQWAIRAASQKDKASNKSNDVDYAHVRQVNSLQLILCTLSTWTPTHLSLSVVHRLSSIHLFSGRATCTS